MAVKRILLAMGVLLAAFAFKPQIAAAQTMEYVETVHIETGEILLSIAWSPDNQYVAVSGEMGVRVYSADFELVTQLTFEDNPFTISTVWSPDGQMAASLVESRGVYIWKVPDFAIVDFWQPPAIVPSALDWSPDGSKIVTQHFDGTVKIYDLKQQSVVNTFDISSQASLLDWHPDSRRLLFVERGQVVVWDTVLNEETDRILSSILYMAIWSPDGNEIATAAYVRETTAYTDLPALWVIYLWQPERHVLEPILVSFGSFGDARISSLAWHPDGELLASYSQDRQIRIWDIGNRALIAQLESGPRLDDPSYNSIAWSPDGSRLGDVSSDGTIRVWSAVDD